MDTPVLHSVKETEHKTDRPIHVYSEIGKLTSVLLKRPGKEVENLTPDIMDRLLFDDIPYITNIQKEHDFFAETLRQEGVGVLYLDKLAAEAIDAGNAREMFVRQILTEANIDSVKVNQALYEYLLSMDTLTLVQKVMAGVRTNEIKVRSDSLIDLSQDDDYPFYLDPMPNLYFTRDPAASIGDGLTINKMTFPARQKESLFMQMIMQYHPDFANTDTTVWLDRDNEYHIEGGDELVLSNTVLAVGISQRTSANAIERLAHSLFEKHTSFEKVVAIVIPHNRAMMHLDTVLTMVDHDKFTVHPEIMSQVGEMDIFIIEPDNSEKGLHITHKNNLQAVLKEVLHCPELALIPCGGGDAIVAPREQWNDGSNTLAIAPGVVVTYDRNYVSNKNLRSYGIRVIEVTSGELSRGRGGPRCMSMPLYREDIV